MIDQRPNTLTEPVSALWMHGRRPEVADVRRASSFFWRFFARTGANCFPKDESAPYGGLPSMISSE